MFKTWALIVNVFALLGATSGLSDMGAPTAARAPATILPPAPKGMMGIKRAPDGFFHVQVVVNDQPIDFIVDTGASVMMLTRADAERVGVLPTEDEFDARVATAGGELPMAWQTLRKVTVAGRDLDHVKAGVPQSGLPVSLLGQNVLSRLGSLMLSGDALAIGHSDDAHRDQPPTVPARSPDRRR